MVIAQIIAAIIFVAMFVEIVRDKIPRHFVTLGSGALVIVVVFGICMRSVSAIWETLNLTAFFETEFWYGASESTSAGINWETILFIAGMMVMVGGLGHAGFFSWLCLKLAKMVNYRIVPLLICFMCMSAFLAMFIDSITVILFLATATVSLSQILRFDPVPMIMAEVFCANLGGSATMCGDPPNIIIGTALGYTFGDFITNTGIIAAIGFVFTVLYFWLCFRKPLKAAELANSGVTEYPDPKSAITNKTAFIGATIVFLIAVVLLATHAQTGLTVSTIGVVAAVLTLINVGVTGGMKDIVSVMKEHLDYKTLLFFIGLFISVGGLEQTGVLELLADLIVKVTGGKLIGIIAVILWLSAIASAVVDNIPFAATMVPVIRSIAAVQGIDLQTMAWTLALGTDLGGSATPIGASANVVGISVAGKAGHHISWGKYCKYCIPATIIVIGISMLCLFVRFL